MPIPDDRLGAFCSDRDIYIPGAAQGSLSGLTFAAKDVYDIAGFRTGAGNPDWLNTHPPARHTASAVQRVLDAGATLVGKTLTDELTFSLNGENHHYGTPVNPNAPGRVPGGSSSGSASATAGRLVDFALGTDTGGSVRLPASNCGIYGFRPTHGVIPNDQVVPLAPSFDTVGWFTRDAEMLARVGDVLLPNRDPRGGGRRLLLASDAFQLTYPGARDALDRAARRIAGALGPAEPVSLYDGEAEAWMTAFRTLQGTEIWQCHGEWIRKNRPAFGPDIQARFDWAAALDPREVSAAQAVRDEVTRHLDELLGEDGLLCLPTSPTIALKMASSPDEQDHFRSRALTLLCVAGLARLPQVSLPLATYSGCPLGLSLIGPRNSDRWLLESIAFAAG